MRSKKFFISLFIFLSFSFLLNAQTKNTSPEPYNQDEFPQLMKDLRRFEVITLGSMPFVTLDAAIVYNGYKYATGKTSKFNPLATADYKPDEMKKIIITSLCVSTGIGITDYVIRLIKRKSSQRKERQEYSGISIEENPDAVKIQLPQKNEEPPLEEPPQEETE